MSSLVEEIAHSWCLPKKLSVGGWMEEVGELTEVRDWDETSELDKSLSKSPVDMLDVFS